MSTHIKNIVIPADGASIEYHMDDGTKIVKQLGRTIEPTYDSTTHCVMALANAVLRLSERLDLLLEDA